MSYLERVQINTVHINRNTVVSRIWLQICYGIMVTMDNGLNTLFW